MLQPRVDDNKGLQSRGRSLPMHCSLALTLAALVSLFCVGCAPFPHQVTRSPEIRGTLHRAGQPMADARVFLAHGPADAPCSREAASARTDAQGQFSFERQTEMRFVYQPLVAPISVLQFSLCADAAAGSLLLHQDVVRVYDTPTLVLHCTFGRFAQGPRTLQAEPQPCKH